MAGTSGSKPHNVPPSLYYKPYPSPLATFFDVVADKKLFKLALEHLHRGMGSKYLHFISTKNPTVGGKELDLHLLFKLVTARGGLERVTKDRKWKEINAVFNYPSTTTSASYILRNYYESILLHFEKLYFFGAHGYNYVPDPRSTGCLGATATFTVTGVIDAKFQGAYLATIYYSGKKMQAVLYHAATLGLPGQHLTPNQLVQHLTRMQPQWRPLTTTQPERRPFTIPLPDWMLLTTQPDRPLTRMQPDNQLTGMQPEQKLTGNQPEKQLNGMQPEQKLTEMQPEKQVIGNHPEKQLNGMQLEQMLTEMQPEQQVIGNQPEKQLTGMQVEKQVTWKHPEQVSEVGTGYIHSSESRKKLSKLDPMHLMSDSSGYKFYFRSKYAELNPPFSSGGEKEIKQTIAEQWSKLPEGIKDMYQEIAFSEKKNLSKADCAQCPMTIRQVAPEEDFQFKTPALPNPPPIPDYDQKQTILVKVEHHRRDSKNDDSTY